MQSEGCDSRAWTGFGVFQTEHELSRKNKNKKTQSFYSKLKEPKIRKWRRSDKFLER